MAPKPARILALDLEGTLISNALSQIPRPGLHAFLGQCRDLFPRIAVFTTVKEQIFRDIAQLLVTEGFAPAWFAEVEYVAWEGATKDLAFIAAGCVEEAVLVDDYESYVHQGQEAQWVHIAQFAWPYPESDRALSDVITVLERRVLGA